MADVRIAHGTRVRTAGILTATFGSHVGNGDRRRAGAEGTVQAFGPGKTWAWVLHDDGLLAPYVPDEIAPIDALPDDAALVTAEELAEVDRLHAEATPDPWEETDPDEDGDETRIGPFHFTHAGKYDAWEADRAIVQRGRTLLPRLTAEVRRQAAVIEDERRTHAATRGQLDREQADNKVLLDLLSRLTAEMRRTHAATRRLVAEAEALIGVQPEEPAS